MGLDDLRPPRKRQAQGQDAGLPCEAMQTINELGSRRLMVVDDDPDLVDSLCDWICLCSDWTAIGAYGSADAIAQTGQSAPDAILLDMQMDGVDGFETAGRLEIAAGAKHPTFFAMTGDDRLRTLASLDSRFSASILKPADMNGLLELLEKVSADH